MTDRAGGECTIPVHDQRPDRYRLYVDESGDHAYSVLDQPSHRYLALLGVWFRQEDDYVVFADSLDALKRRVFGPRPDDPVILHRSDIINRKGAFGMLRDTPRRMAFDDGLLGLVSTARFAMACVIIESRASGPLLVAIPSVPLLHGGDAGPIWWVAQLQERRWRRDGGGTRPPGGSPAQAGVYQGL